MRDKIDREILPGRFKRTHRVTKTGTGGPPDGATIGCRVLVSELARHLETFTGPEVSAGVFVVAKGATSKDTNLNADDLSLGADDGLERTTVLCLTT